jgi:hypothetical protein
VCPGYPDPVSIHFRNETASVTRRVQEKKGRKLRSPRTHFLDDQNGHISNLVTIPEDIALAYFMLSFAPTSPFSYLPSFWFDLAQDKSVCFAVNGTALASLALGSNRSELMHLARSYYSKALARTNNALSCPQLAILDSTLLNVLLLTAFEAVVYRGRATPTSWAVHVQGTVALLTIRGERQFDSVMGQKLFHQASMNIRASYSQRRISVPSEISNLQKYAATVMGATNGSYRMCMLVDRFVTLRANMRGMPATAVVREALDLDKEANELLEERKLNQPYKVLLSEDSPAKISTYKGVLHQYISQSSARVYNTFRMFLLFFNEWVFCAYQQDLRGVIVDRPTTNDPLHYDWDQLPMKAALKGEEMIEQILASVPYSLELLEESSSASARLLIWPLASIGTSELCPMSAKNFVINRLKALAERHELLQAMEAATMLEEGVSIEDW